MHLFYIHIDFYVAFLVLQNFIYAQFYISSNTDNKCKNCSILYKLYKIIQNKIKIFKKKGKILCVSGGGEYM